MKKTILILMCVISLACKAQLSESDKAMFTNACAKAYENNQWKEGIPCADTLLFYNPKDTFGLLSKGRFYIMKGNDYFSKDFDYYFKADSVFDVILSMDSSYTKAWWNKYYLRYRMVHNKNHTLALAKQISKDKQIEYLNQALEYLDAAEKHSKIKVDYGSDKREIKELVVELKTGVYNAR